MRSGALIGFHTVRDTAVLLLQAISIAVRSLCSGICVTSCLLCSAIACG